MKVKILLASLLAVSQLMGTNPIDDFIQNPLMQHANVSVMVRNLKTGEDCLKLNEDKSMVPASTMKLVSTATALDLLGADFRFKTRLEVDGEISNDSVLFGNLYIHGGGDPTLGSEKIGNQDFLKEWTAAVRAAGIAHIRGNVIADASLFDDEGVNPRWTWEDMGNYYAAGAYGITYLDNTLRVTFRSGEVGTRPSILKMDPEIEGLTIDNRLHSTTISGDSAYFYGAPFENNRTVRGEIPANRSEFLVKADIPNPALLLAVHFRKKMIAAGIRIDGSATDQFPAVRRKEIFVYQSPTLAEVITETNVHSNNLYAEHVFKCLGLQHSSPATTTKALGVIRNHWKLKGLPVDELFMYDGCGLSPGNAVSSRFFVEMLSYMHSNATIFPAFYNSLPVAGMNGTLASVLKGTVLQGKVHAKSGTISRVRCYAGYFDWGENAYAFAVLVNNANGGARAVTHKIEELLLSFTSSK